jgi:hypothetical protein
MNDFLTITIATALSAISVALLSVAFPGFEAASLARPHPCR